MHEVDIVAVPASKLAVRRFHVEAQQVAQIGVLFSEAIGSIMKALAEADVTPIGPPVARYLMTADGFDVAGPMWEQYLSPPQTPPEETRTEIYWPLKAGAREPEQPRGVDDAAV